MPQNPSPTAARARIGPLDWLMLLLALVSVGLLLWETFWQLPAETTELIIRTDLTICGIFAVEFVWRWSRAGWGWGFVGRNWYEIIGMIPFSQPALRGFRLFRVVRIVVMVSRFGRAADRAMGDEFFYRLVNRFSGGIIDAIKAPITAAVLEQAAIVMAKGQYTSTIARTLEDREGELGAMIAQKLREDPQTGRLSRLPFYEDILQAVARTAFRVVMDVMKDPRTDAVVADMLRENVLQLRTAVIQRQAEQRHHEKRPPKLS